ncbi:carbohydrate esterase [Tripterygium wilfordii]|uniref:Carbohydrate esterase n=1 Tax=Tripterygium wilfordii TaxID=458696 RepID=A0A7J7D2S3_TRIWF|nr:probable carbohydrate esterase At4g34215 [Tripterygium wilfordii]KAF5740644.1 carbohydrate esterase [Tripterygium wilfordii]
MMLFLLVLILIGHASSEQSQQPPINIFILAGQSNMAGRGGVVSNTKTGITTWDGIVPPQCQSNPSILRLSADLKWVLAREPLHADIDATKTNGIGPGMSFANAILTKDNGFGFVGLVPCAIGGTNISQWEKGGVLYEQLVRRTEAAVQSGGKVKALLWYQGESDTITREDAEMYEGRLKKFFTDVRSDLQSPLLPIFQVALASGQGPYMDIVREAQLGINLVNLRSVDAKGLPLEPDGLHLTTQAQIVLGEMLANAYLQSPPSPVHASSPSKSGANRVISFDFLSCLLVCVLLRSLM